MMRTRVLLIASLLVAGSVACSLIVDSDAKQCSSDDDCRSRGSLFQGAFCNDQHVCVRSLDYCFTNAECIDRTGDNAQICRQDTHRCVGLTTKTCKVLSEPDDLRDPNVVLMGIHGIPSWAPTTQGCENAIELVRRDFRDVLGGLPATPDTGGKPRPVAWISCDVPIGQRELNKAVSDHLYHDVGVVSTFGPFGQADWLSYALPIAIGANSSIYHVIEDEPGFQFAGRKGHFFASALPPGIAVKAQTVGLSLLEEVVRRKVGDRPLKVAYMYQAIGVVDSDAALFTAQAVWNGKSATENGPTLYKQFGWGLNDNTFSEKIATLSLQVKDFAPDIVLFRGPDEQVDIMKAIEAVYPVPYYLFSIEATNSIAGVVGANENLRSRILGHRAGRYQQDPKVLAFSQRYTQLFEANTLSPLTRICFDLGYLQMYSAAAVNGPLNGSSIGNATLTRFDFTGDVIESAPSSILRAMDTLKAGRNVRFDGVETTHVYDDTGALKGWNFQFWCVDPDRTKTSRILDTGNGFDGITNTQIKVPITCL